MLRNFNTHKAVTPESTGEEYIHSQSYISVNNALNHHKTCTAGDNCYCNFILENDTRSENGAISENSNILSTSTSTSLSNMQTFIYRERPIILQGETLEDDQISDSSSNIERETSRELYDVLSTSNSNSMFPIESPTTRNYLSPVLRSLSKRQLQYVMKLSNELMPLLVSDRRIKYKNIHKYPNIPSMFPDHSLIFPYTFDNVDLQSIDGYNSGSDSWGSWNFVSQILTDDS